MTVLLALVFVPACGKRCDKAGLAEAAEAMQDRSAAGRQLAFKTLGTACPALPTALGESLVAGYGDAPADFASTVYASRFDDPGYADVRKKTCPVEKDAWRAAIESDDRDAAVFEVCGLERYGLLNDGESFAYPDLDAYVLYEWLKRGRNDLEVARTLVRGLMTVTADEEELLAGCLDAGVGCRAAASRMRLDLPTTSTTEPLRDGVTLVLTPEAVKFDGEVVAEVSAGEGFQHHVSPPLLDVLRKEADRGRAQAEEQMMEWEGRIRLLADGRAPLRDVADVLFTANKAGLTQYQLVGLSDGRAVGVAVNPPRDWIEGLEPPRGERATRLEVDVHANEVQTTISDNSSAFAATGDCDEAPGECFDTDALEAWFKQVKVSHPDTPVATFNIDPDVRLQTVMMLIDAARGRDCRMYDLMDEVPPECLFWLPIVDLNPGLYFAIDLDKKVTLGDTKTRTVNEKVKPRRVNEKDILERYDENREALARCLEENEAFRRDSGTPPSYQLMFGSSVSETNPIALQVWDGEGDDPFADADLHECMSQAMGASLEIGTRATFTPRVEVELTLPITVETSPKKR